MHIFPQTEVQDYTLTSTSIEGKKKLNRKAKADFCRNILGITISASGAALWIHCCFMPTTYFSFLMASDDATTAKTKELF